MDFHSFLSSKKFPTLIALDVFDLDVVDFDVGLQAVTIHKTFIAIVTIQDSLVLMSQASVLPLGQYRLELFATRVTVVLAGVWVVIFFPSGTSDFSAGSAT